MEKCVSSLHLPCWKYVLTMQQIVLGVVCFLTVLISFIIHVTLTCMNGCGPPVKSPGPYITYFPQTTLPKPQTGEKLLLLWTTNFGDVNWGVQDFTGLFDQCQVKMCKVTNDKNKLVKSDAVLFHSRSVWNYFVGITMPSSHPLHQLWILHDYEPPPNVYLNMAAYNNIFNWTMTYRLDADFRVPYGRMVRKEDESVAWEFETNATLVAFGQTNRDKPNNEHNFASSNYHGEKTKLIAWTASNCVAQSRRQRIVKQLQKYLTIDTFGACGEKKLTCSSLKCEEELGVYRFYLAFENSFCKDYISEKLFNTLDRAQIPIVYGQPDYSKMIPKNSYIDMNDFDSIEELANYIKMVDSNEELYNSFMWWREFYKIETYPSFWCDLCSAVHASKPPQVYSDLDGWFRNDSCQQFSVYNHISSHVEGYLLNFNLIK